MKPDSTAIPRALLGAMLLFLVGCSVKFMYNQLDWLVPWYLDDYVSLNSDQQRLFGAELKNYLETHRREQLPAYADFLDWAADSAVEGFQPDDVEHLQNQLRRFSDALFTQLASSMLQPVAQLDDSQVEELLQNLQRENAEFREEYVAIDDKEHRRKRVNEMRKFLYRWIGDLGEPQALLLKQWSTEYRRMGKDFIASRQAWQLTLKQVLALRKDPARLEPALLKLFSEQRTQRTPAYREKAAFNERLLKRLYLDLDRSLDAEQRQHLVRKLRAMAQDFRELASE